MKSLAHYGQYLLPATALLAALSLMFHALPHTRQPDVQHIEYAFELMKAVHDGAPQDYLLQPQKYPLLSVLPLSVLYGGTLSLLRVTGKLPSFSQADLEGYIFNGPWELHLGTRIGVVLMGILLMYLVYGVSKKLFPAISPWYAVALLLSSMLFLSFMTAMRQHVPEVALTFLAFAASLTLAQEKSLKNEIFAFGAATLAFCVLQNGLFALIFPVWAMATHQGAFMVHRLFRPRLMLYVIAFFFVSSIFGYTFLWKELVFEHKLGFGLGNEDIGESPWGIAGFIVAVRTLIGSETFPFLFTLITLWHAFKKRVTLHPFLLSVLIYIVVYTVFFGFVGWTTPRYFFPFTPFLAVLGAPAFARLNIIHIPFYLLIAAVHLKLAFLGLQPDTYDLARSYVLTETSGPIATTVPHYYLGIPPTQASIGEPTMAKERYIQSLSADLPDARDFVALTDERAKVFITTPDSVSLPAGWTACETITSSRSPDKMFLWTEVEWPFYWIFQGERMGPNIVIGCRD